MTSPVSTRAFGQPGTEPRWARASKEGVGTAYSGGSRVWYTVWRGFLTEVYYPTIDLPQVRDLQYLVTDGATFFHDEKHNLPGETERLCPSLGYRVRRAEPDARYSLEKTIIADPHLPCVLQHTRVEGDDGLLQRLKLYVLCAPHLEVGGWSNNAQVIEEAGRRFLTAEKDGRWLALGANVPFSRASVGYVGASDGWTDLHQDLRLDWEFTDAPDGNVALTGEIDVAQHREFTVGLAFGETRHAALTTLVQSLSVPFEKQRERFHEQWERTATSRLPLESCSGDNGNLYRSSHSVLLAHEDKTYQGALIASLSIPWGEAKADEEGRGGYHLVWTRDMVHSAMGLLAAGNTQTPFRALIYLAMSQNPDGSFPQNFWVDGRPYWNNIQHDEIALPIVLARRLHREGALQEFNAADMVLRAIRYLILEGPVSPQERWEEASGYSPSTLAAHIAATICVAAFAREHGHDDSATFLEEYADWMRDHLADWVVTRAGTLLPGVTEHFVRINPAQPGEATEPGAVDRATLTLTSRPPGTQADYPAREIVDAGFLELVRFGIIAADDPLVVNSLKVIDATLKVDTPFGPCWRRYNHDGYGQGPGGEPYAGYGQGRAWPLLTGERGHHELAAGRDPRPYIEAMERFGSRTGLLPEQVWDADDLPDKHLHLGHPTGSAVPLVWAHSEYMRLLRSARDGVVFDRIPEVAERYLQPSRPPATVEMWGLQHPVRFVAPGRTLRIVAGEPFRVRWSADQWQTQQDTDSQTTRLDISFADIAVPQEQQAPIRFTLYWTGGERWEGKDFEVAVRA